MKTALFIINEIGSFYNHRAPILCGLEKESIKPVVLMPFDSEQKQKLESDFPRFEFIPWSLNRGSKNPLSAILSTFNAWKIIRLKKPDVVHSFTVKGVLYGTLAAYLAGVPKIVSSITGAGSVFIGKGKRISALRKLIVLLYRIILNKSSVVIFQNTENRELFIKLALTSKEKSLLVEGSGVDLNKYRRLDNVQSVPGKIIFPARMIADKGLDELLGAFTRFSSEYPEYSLYLCGDIDQHNPSSYTKAQMESKLKDQTNIFWLGHVNDMLHMYQEAEIVCLPSYGEGLSKTLIEAAACECVLITSNVAGCREVLRGGAGYLCEPRSEESLYLAFKKAHLEKESWNTLRKKARFNAEKYFSLDHVVASYKAVYDS